MDNDKLIEHVEDFFKENPKLGFSIEEYRLKLDLKRQISELKSKGTRLDIPKISKKYSEKASQDKKPISAFINPTDFRLEKLRKTQRNFLSELMRSMQESKEDEEEINIKVQEMEKYLELMDSKPELFEQVISCALTNDVEKFMSLAEESEIDSLLFYNLGVSLIQPLMEELGNQISSQFRETWWRRECPVCGREATVGKLKNRKRYFICNFCCTEYMVDFFICNHCDNNDENDLAFYTIEGLNHLEIDFCKKCSHYVKIINVEKAPKPIPPGLEDIFTLQLDYIAKQKELIRDF